MLEKMLDWAISSQAAEESVEGSTTRAWSPERTVKPHECAATKVCKVCGEAKPLESFSKGRSQCKPCRCELEKRRADNPEYREKRNEGMKAYYRSNRQAFNKANAERYAANKDARLAAVKEHQAKPEVKERRNAMMAVLYQKKRDAIRQQQAEYRKQNLEVFTAKDARRRAALINAKPAWADDSMIDAVYKEAADLTRNTGVKHVVDHIVPLQGRTVCGLHVAGNLQVLTERENLRKSNKHTG